MREAFTFLAVLSLWKDKAVAVVKARMGRFESRSGRWWRYFATPIVVTIAACSGGGDGGPPVHGPSGSLTFTSCTVPDGGASCPGSVGWTTSNAVMPRLSVDGVTLSEEASGTISLDLPGHFVDVVLADGEVTLDSVKFRGVCESASAWDGAVCTPYSIRLDERIPTTFLENGEPVELEVVMFKPFGPGRTFACHRQHRGASSH